MCDTKPANTCNLRLSQTVRADCCKVSDPIPQDVTCFMSDICQSLKQLHDRHARMFVKRPRLLEMAKPLRRRIRYVPKCACLFEKTVQIVPAELPIHTRTELLALPMLKRLNQSKAKAVKRGDVVAQAILNRFLRQNYLSLYSRLSNTPAPKPPKKKKKKTQKQKKKHAAAVEKLAIPKKEIKPEKIERKKGEISEKRLKKLATPKIRVVEVKKEWDYTPELRSYKASKRIIEISKPMIRENVHIAEEPFKVQPSALKYKASARVKELAQASAMRERKVDADLKEDPFSITANALKYKASTRIKELAEPKEYENTHIRDNPFYISPAALKAKASARIIELAKPRGG